MVVIRLCKVASDIISGRLLFLRIPLDHTRAILVCVDSILTQFEQLVWSVGFLYYTVLWLVKASFLSTYFRVVRRNWVRKLLRGVSIYSFIAFLGCIITHAIWCQPVSKNCNNPLGYIPLKSI